MEYTYNDPSRPVMRFPDSSPPFLAPNPSKKNHTTDLVLVPLSLLSPDKHIEGEIRNLLSPKILIEIITIRTIRASHKCAFLTLVDPSAAQAAFEVLDGAVIDGVSKRSCNVLEKEESNQ